MLDSIPKRARRQLLEHFVRLQASPDQYSDYHQDDGNGRRVEITLFGGYAIVYWIDFADRHVKILEIDAADR